MTRIALTLLLAWLIGWGPSSHAVAVPASVGGDFYAYDGRHDSAGLAHGTAGQGAPATHRSGSGDHGSQDLQTGIHDQDGLDRYTQLKTAYCAEFTDPWCQGPTPHAAAEAGADLATIFNPWARLLKGLRILGRSTTAANAVTRSLDDVASLRGATTAEVEGLIPLGWVKSATNASKGGLGIRYFNPERLGEQIRIMPGKVTDPKPLKQWPYMRISRNGTVTDPIPLFGNPTL